MMLAKLSMNDDVPANCHIFWVFFSHFWPDKWVCRSFTHCNTFCRFATNIFVTDFQSNRLKGCEI